MPTILSPSSGSTVSTTFNVVTTCGAAPVEVTLFITGQPPAKSVGFCVNGQMTVSFTVSAGSTLSLTAEDGQTPSDAVSNITAP